MTRALASFVTLTAMAMASAAAWERGGGSIDRALLVALSVAICAGAHLLPAVSKRKMAWLLWVGCLLGTIYSHLVFFTHTSLHAVEVRAQQSSQVAGVQKQIEAVREALSGISARPVSVIAAELAVTNGWRKRRALEAELSEAKRAAGFRDALVRLNGKATEAGVASATDPVTERIASVTGSSESSISLLIGLGFAILLELVGALLWVEVLRPTLTSANSKPSRDPLAEMRAAIDAGKLKPTVAGIRSFLGCSQAKAMELRRSIK